MSNRAFFILIALIVMSPVAVIAAILYVINLATGRPLPFHFTQSFYEATPSLVCPGDTITWTAVIEVNENVSSTTSTSVRTWINVATGATIQATPLGEITTFVWGDWPGVADYYREFFGREVEQATYPYQVPRTLTATVPESAPYDTPVMLVTASLTQADPSVRYGVPIWVKSKNECN